MRNDRTNIEDAEIILVGDSFITANGTTQEHIPSNILSEISGKKVAALSYGGLDAMDYEIFIDKHLDKIKKIDGSKYFEWGGHQLPLVSGKIRVAYERLERNKDKFLLRVLSEKNYFLRNIRAKSHIMYRKFFSKLHNTNSPIKYFKIGNKAVGFFYNENSEINNEYNTYIFKDNKILERITGVFIYQQN